MQGSIMAKSKFSGNVNAVKNHSLLNLSFVPEDEVQGRLKLGYQHLMVKMPTLEEIPENLNVNERKCLRILMDDKAPKEIAGILQKDERTIRLMLESVRKKFGCHTNIGVVRLVYQKSINNFL